MIRGLGEFMALYIYDIVGSVAWMVLWPPCDLWPGWICGLIRFVSLLGLWLQRFYSLSVFVDRNGLWP